MTMRSQTCSREGFLRYDAIMLEQAGRVSNRRSLRHVQVDICAVTQLPERAFAFCDGLHTLEFTQGSGSDEGQSCSQHDDNNAATSSQDSSSFAVLTHIGKGAFEFCASLEGVAPSFPIPNSVTHIGAHAFRHCTSLQRVDLPDSIVELGHGAFVDCRHLQRIRLSESLTAIPDECFAGCDQLTHVEIPSSVASIGKDAFARCTSLQSVVIRERSTGGEDDDSGNTKKAMLKSIGPGSFHRCSSLTQFAMPQNKSSNATNKNKHPISIGEQAFAGCPPEASASFQHQSTRNKRRREQLSSLGCILGRGSTTRRYYHDAEASTACQRGGLAPPNQKRFLFQARRRRASTVHTVTDGSMILSAKSLASVETTSPL